MTIFIIPHKYMNYLTHRNQKPTRFVNELVSVVNRISIVLLISFTQQGAILTIEEAFGEVIRELRKANQLSQEKLDEGSNLDRSFISLLECGRKQPSMITIFQIARAFNLPVSKILSLVEVEIIK